MSKLQQTFEIMELLKQKPRTIKEVAIALKIDYQSARRTIKELEKLNRVEKRIVAYYHFKNSSYL